MPVALLPGRDGGRGSAIIDARATPPLPDAAATCAAGSEIPSHGRGLGQRVAEVVVEDDERAVLRVEADERPLDEVTVGQVAGRVGARGLVDGLDLDLDGAAPSPAGLVEAAVHEESMEPGIEPVRDHEARAGPARLAPGCSGPRRARAPGP